MKLGHKIDKLNIDNKIVDISIILCIIKIKEEVRKL